MTATLTPKKSAENSLNDLLKPYQERIEKAIEETVVEMGPDSPLRKACAYVLQSIGKRLRPAIVLMIQDTLNQNMNAMPSALAIEFFHTASLIADDLPCMDDDDLRRNQPSAHKAYGEAVALLSSYALIASGYGLIAKNKQMMLEGDENILTIALENAAYNTGLLGATGGQFFDLVPPDKTESTLRRIIHMKTTSLFEISFVFGWLFGGGDQKKLPIVKQAACHFGLIFQILDDLDDFERDRLEGGLNIASILGVDKTLELFRSEMRSFNEALNLIGFSEGPLHKLASIMEEMILKF